MIIDGGAVLSIIVMEIVYIGGFTIGRNTAKDKYYIKGYRDGLHDSDKSMQEIISKIKETEE